MTLSELEIHQWLKQEGWNESQVSLDVLDTKNKAMNLVNLKSREEILKEYWVVEWEKSEYDFLEEIDNLNLFIDILWKKFWYDENWRIWLSVLKSFKFLWINKWLIEKVNYFWLWILDNDYENIKKWGHNKFSICSYEWVNFLKNLDLEKFKEIRWDFYSNDNKLCFYILREENLRDLLTENLDKYLKLRNSIEWFIYNKIIKHTYDSLFYSIIDLDDFNQLINLYKFLNIDNSDDEKFISYLEITELFFSLYPKDWLNNLIYLNNNLEGDPIIKDIPRLVEVIGQVENLFSIDNEVLRNSLELFWKWNISLDKNSDFCKVLKILNKNTFWGKTEKENFDLLKLLHSRFWDDIFKEELILRWIFKSDYKASDLISWGSYWIIDEYDLQWKNWIEFLNFIFWGKWEDILKEYLEIEKTIPEIFSYRNFFKHKLIEFSDDLNVVLIGLEKEYCYLFSKYSDDFLRDKKWFLDILKSNYGCLNWIWNILNIKEIFWFEISFEDFKKYSEIFIARQNLENEFKILKENFPDKIKTLDDLLEFKEFYDISSDCTLPKNFEYYKGYNYIFSKFWDDFLRDKKWFLDNLIPIALRSEDWSLNKFPSFYSLITSTWIINVKSVEEIFWIEVSFEDFKKYNDIFTPFRDFKIYFKFLKENFSNKINNLDDLLEFKWFYTSFRNQSIQNHHIDIINKLEFDEKDIKSEDKMFEISSMYSNHLNDLLQLENHFWKEVLFKYLWKKDDIIEALKYNKTLTSFWGNISILMEYIWKIWEPNKYDKFWNILNNLIGLLSSGEHNNFFDSNRVEKFIKIIHLKWIDAPSKFIINFLKANSEEEEKDLLLKYDEIVNNLIELKPIKSSYWFEDDIACMVYNGVDYYTPETLDDYKDNSSHLKDYIYDKTWYKMIFSWLNWYKLKDWEKVDENLMNIFRKRVENIKEMSKWESHISKFMQDSLNKIIPDFQFSSEKIEFQIIQYFKEIEKNKQKFDIEDMDVLLAYQLLWRFEEFQNASNDKILRISNKHSKNAFQLEALINEYGDSLKETINAIERKIVASQDKKDLEIIAPKTKNLQEKAEYKNLVKKRLLEQIIRSFINIPEDKLNFKIVEKSLKTRFSTTLQTNSFLQERVLDLVNMFDLEDFKALSNEENIKKLEIKLEKNVLKFLQDNYKIDLDLKMIHNLQWEIYKTLKKENDKYEEKRELEQKSNWELVKKSSKDRNVIWYFSKTKEQAKARWVWWICIWNDKEMWSNPNYFEFLLMDLDRKKNIWTTMLLKIEDNNKKYLLFCPNPSEEFTSKVSSKDLYNSILKNIVSFASDNNFDGIIVDTSHWHWTNRWWAFQTVFENSVLRDDNWELVKIDLQKIHELWTYSGITYEYKDNLNFVWKR